MTTFDDRERAFEAKFAHDEEMQFRAAMRRNKILALWAAGLMDYEPDRAASYVKDLIQADLAHPGDQDVFDKLKADLGERVSDTDLRTRMEAAMTEAKAQIVADG